jgi:hypothetical protein
MDFVSIIENEVILFMRITRPSGMTACPDWP